jgi:hypothetical protein
MFGVAAVNNTVDWNVLQYKAIEATDGAYAPLFTVSGGRGGADRK